MNKQYEMVRKFHTACGIEMPTKPTMLDNGGGHTTEDFSFKLDNISNHMKFTSSSDFGGQILPRVAYMVEELSELLAATTIEDQADALADLIYFALGTYTLMGVKPERIFDIVANSNLGKILPDGSVIRNPDTGKIGKPDGWEEAFAPEPLIIKEIERQTRTAECTTCNGTKQPVYGLECPTCN